jgi:signal transduction histidine kinase
LVDPHALAARHSLDDGSHLIITGTLVGLWIATALVFPFVQRRIYRFVDRTLLGRANYREFRPRLARALAGALDAESALDVACSLIARVLGANDATWSAVERPESDGHPVITVDARRTNARISIPTTLDPAYELHLKDLSAGRSLLSDDLMLIDAAAALVGRRIDECRIDADRRARAQREEEMRRLTAEAELRALRAQLNPHFLFNALTTLGHLMQSAPDRALSTLYQLTGLLRAVLRRTNGQFVSLAEELEIVQSYLAIERERFEERLAVTIDVPAGLELSRIPPLLLQPLVENAVKHGIAPLKAGGAVRVRAWRDRTADAGNMLRLEVVDTGLGVPPHAAKSHEGVGLANIERRLAQYFGSAAGMSIRETPGGGTTVELRVPWLGPESSSTPAA